MSRRSDDSFLRKLPEPTRLLIIVKKMDSKEKEIDELEALRKTRLTSRQRFAIARYPILDIRLYGSKARGGGREDSDLDVMIEIPGYGRAEVAEMDAIIYRINLECIVFISAVVFGKDELEEGPMSEAPIYKVIRREGVSL